MTNEQKAKKAAYSRAYYKRRLAADPDYNKKYHAKCRAQRCAYARRYAAERAARHPNYILAHTANTTARKHGLAGRITEHELDLFMRYYHYTCLGCGTIEGVGLDHIVPFSKDGQNDLENIQPLCSKSCNPRKGVKIIDYRPAYEAGKTRIAA